MSAVAATTAAVAAVASALAAVGAGIVAWRATEIERTKVRLELHARRIAVFRAIQEALTSVKQNTANIQGDITKVKQAYQDAWFLFPKSMLKTINSIYDDLIELDGIVGTNSSLQTARQAGELKKKCISQLDGLYGTFEPHMKLPF